MSESVWPLLICARAAAVLCAVAWIGVWVRRAGLVPTRWLSATALALYVACFPRFVAELLPLRFPPGEPPYEWNVNRIIPGWDALLAECSPFILLLPIAAGIGCWRVRRSRLHGFAEASAWCVVTLPLAWVWFLTQLPPPFHALQAHLVSERIVDLAVGPWIAAAACVCAVILRRLARRGELPGPMSWLALAGPVALLAASPRWSAFFHARAALPELGIEDVWCTYIAPPRVDVWPAGPEICDSRERPQLWCRGRHSQIALFQEGATSVQLSSTSEDATYAAVPPALVLANHLARVEDRLDPTVWGRKSADFWPSRAMSGATLADWVSVLTAAGVDRVYIFAQLAHVEHHPRYGELRRHQSCPLGYLTLADLETVRRWESLDAAVLGGSFRALQGDRPRLTIRGDGSALDRELAAVYADLPR